ncbi:MAG: DUF3343 domain-containing protein [Armatimonadota bacterium]|nr:DUF3343 domain-containing protein [Armatimonadota bacterium]
MEKYGVVLFHSQSSAFRAEKILLKAGIECRLIPIPRSLSSDCGVAARFEWARVADVERALNAADVEIQGIHPMPSR